MLEFVGCQLNSHFHVYHEIRKRKFAGRIKNYGACQGPFYSIKKNGTVILNSRLLKNVIFLNKI